MASPRRYYKSHLPLYDYPIYVTTTPEGFTDILKLHGRTAEDCDFREVVGGRCMHLEHEPSGAVAIVILVRRMDLGIITHECGHAALYICDTMGVDVEGTTGEAFCYILGGVASIVADGLAKLGFPEDTD